MKKLKVGVVGLGMGRYHADTFSKNPHVQLAALCDKNPDLLKKQAFALKVKKTYTDPQTLFTQAGLDAVTIATPNFLHAPLTIAALKAGLHVLCEKPIALNVQEAEQMQAAAEKAGKNLMINFSFRYMPASYAIKRQIEAGVLGEIYYGRSVWHRRRGMPGFGGWFSTKAQSGGGPLVDLGVHRLDLALWFMGYPDPVSVTGSVYDKLARQVARARGASCDVEDLACGFIKFRNGATLILEASWALHIKEREYIRTTVCGTKGGAFQTNLDEGYRFSSEIYTEEEGCFFDKKLNHTGVPVPSSCDEFINSILEKRQPDATPEHGIKVMKVLEGIYRSAETGREVRFEPIAGKTKALKGPAAAVKTT